MVTEQIRMHWHANFARESDPTHPQESFFKNKDLTLRPSKKNWLASPPDD